VAIPVAMLRSFDKHSANFLEQGHHVVIVQPPPLVMNPMKDWTLVTFLGVGQSQMPATLMGSISM